MNNTSSKNEDWEGRTKEVTEGDKGPKAEEMKEYEGTSKVEAKESEDVSKRELKEREEMSKAIQAIAQVREEVDQLAERISALEVVVNSGTKVADEEFDVPSELLMRQLLKLDAIEADGEAKIQRKAEVRRVQNFHELLDNLKSSNSKPLGNNSNAVSVTTEWETFDSGVGSLSSPQSHPQPKLLKTAKGLIRNLFDY